jgi:hypothetical protein
MSGAPETDDDVIEVDEIMCAYSDVPGSPFEEAPCLGGCGGPAGSGCQRVMRVLSLGNDLEQAL